MKKIALILLPSLFLLAFSFPISTFEELVQWVKAHPGEVPEMDTRATTKLTGLQSVMYMASWDAEEEGYIPVNTLQELYSLSDEVLLVISDSTVEGEGNGYETTPIWTISAENKRIDYIMGSCRYMKERKELEFFYDHEFYPLAPNPIFKIEQRIHKGTEIIQEGDAVYFADYEVVVDTVVFYEVSSEGKFVAIQTNEAEVREKMAAAKIPTRDEKRTQQLQTMLRQSGMPDQIEATQARGAKSWNLYCKACHSLDKRIVGPPLRGIWEKYRGEEAWLYDWIKNAPKMIVDKDPKALALFEEHNRILQNAFPNLSDQDITDILIYLDQA